MNQNEVFLLFQRYLAAEFRAQHPERVVRWALTAHKEAASVDPVRHMRERARDSTFQFRLQRQDSAGARWIDAT